MPNPFDIIKEIPDWLLKPCNKKYPTTFEEFKDELISILEKYKMQPVARNEIAGLWTELRVLKDMAKRADVDISELFPVTCKTGHYKYIFHMNDKIYKKWYDVHDATWYTEEYTEN